MPFRALLQINGLRQRKANSTQRHNYRQNLRHHSNDRDQDQTEEYYYESISLIDALNLATAATKTFFTKPIVDHSLSNSRKLKTTTDFRYFCSEHAV